MKTRQMAIDSMLAAMCAVLGAVSIEMGNMRLTLESVPILIGALLFGPADGAVIGFVGSFVYQVLRYGFTATTLLWILPYVVCGLVVGFIAKRRGFDMNTRQTVLTVVLAELLITTLNTGALYIDSKVYGYYSAVYVFGTLLPRYAICVGKAVVVGALLPPLLQAVRRHVLNKQ